MNFLIKLTRESGFSLFPKIFSKFNEPKRNRERKKDECKSLMCQRDKRDSIVASKKENSHSARFYSTRAARSRHIKLLYVSAHFGISQLIEKMRLALSPIPADK